jgi:hypothetical protein
VLKRKTKITLSDESEFLNKQIELNQSKDVSFTTKQLNLAVQAALQAVGQTAN